LQPNYITAAQQDVAGVSHKEPLEQSLFQKSAPCLKQKTLHRQFQQFRLACLLAAARKPLQSRAAGQQVNSLRIMLLCAAGVCAVLRFFVSQASQNEAQLTTDLAHVSVAAKQTANNFHDLCSQLLDQACSGNAFMHLLPAIPSDLSS